MEIIDQPALPAHLQSLRAKIDSKEVMLIDVREPSETAGGAAAVLHPLSALKAGTAPKADFSKPVFTHCASGVRAERAVPLLSELGFTDVKSLTEGYLELVEFGFFPPPFESLEICGYHGCPYFITACKIAEALHNRRLVGSVIIRRAGNLHVPEWSSAADRAPFKSHVASFAHTALWDGGSPRVVPNDDAALAMDASNFLRRCQPLLRRVTFGLPLSVADLRAIWPNIVSAGACALWTLAYKERAATDFFSADPASSAPLSEMRNGLRYDDIGSTLGSYPPHAIAGKVLDDAATKVQAVARGRRVRRGLQPSKAVSFDWSRACSALATQFRGWASGSKQTAAKHEPTVADGLMAVLKHKGVRPIDFKDLTFGDEIGTGAFSVVRKCTYVHTSCAIKQLTTAGSSKNDQERELKALVEPRRRLERRLATSRPIWPHVPTSRHISTHISCRLAPSRPISPHLHLVNWALASAARGVRRDDEDPPPARAPHDGHRRRRMDRRDGHRDAVHAGFAPGRAARKGVHVDGSLRPARHMGQRPPLHRRRRRLGHGVHPCQRSAPPRPQAGQRAPRRAGTSSPPAHPPLASPLLFSPALPPHPTLTSSGPRALSLSTRSGSPGSPTWAMPWQTTTGSTRSQARRRTWRLRSSSSAGECH